MGKKDKKQKTVPPTGPVDVTKGPSSDVPRTSPESMDPSASATNMVSLRDHIVDLCTGGAFKLSFAD